jgi:hypothetical protein
MPNWRYLYLLIEVCARRVSVPGLVLLSRILKLELNYLHQDNQMFFVNRSLCRAYEAKRLLIFSLNSLESSSIAIVWIQHHIQNVTCLLILFAITFTVA